MLKELLILSVTSSGLHIGNASKVMLFAPDANVVQVFNAKTERPFAQSIEGAWPAVLERTATLGKYPPSQSVKDAQSATYRMPFESAWPKYSSVVIPQAPLAATTPPVPTKPGIEYIYDVWGYYKIDTAQYGTFNTRTTAMTVKYPASGPIIMVDVVIYRSPNDPTTMVTREGKTVERPSLHVKWAGPCDINTDGRIDAEDTIAFSYNMPDWNEDGVYDDSDRATFLAAFAAAQSRMPVVAPVPDSTPAPTTSPALVNVNTASLSELTALPGIGPTLAQRIIAGRPYASVDALERVSGIGPALVSQLKALTTVK